MASKRVRNDPSPASRPATHPDLPAPLNRRRALRVLSALGAAAAGAAALTALRPEQAQAATASYTDNVPYPGSVLSATNTGSGYGVTGSVNSGYGVYGNSNLNLGVYGTSSSGAGVQGFSSSYIGVLGFSSSSSGSVAGVFGFSSSSSGAGVFGSGSNIGVWGQSTGAAAGVEGDNSSGGPGVFGKNTGPGPGVLGSNSTTAQAAILGSNAGGGPGVTGFATGSGSVGLAGSSDTGYGFFGGATGTGIGALVLSPGGVALVARQTNNGYAGYFQGSVLITGSSTVMGAKSAAVKGADGTLRRLYSLESPESWFEDFGSGQLSGGTATVMLEPGFAGVVHGEDYHVFLTPRADCKGLYVSAQTPGGFTVHELQAGTSAVAFDYRVVARRKDIAGARLERVEEPKLPAPPTLPPPPATPPAPGLPPTHKPPTLPPAP